jgi:hypothetical protein
MDPEFDPKLESLIDAELKELPPVKAPASLAPRVLALLEQRARLPWWQRAWWDWPLAAKAAFLVLAVALAGLAGGGGVMIDQGVVDYSQQVTERLTPVVSLWDPAQTLFEAAGLLWSKTGQPLLLFFLIGVGALYVICLGLGTACVRYAMKRA